MASLLKFFTIKVRILLTFTLLCSLAMYNFSDWVSNTARQYYLEAAEELMIDKLIILKKSVLEQTANEADLATFNHLKDIFNQTDEKHPKAQIYGVTKDTTDTFCYLTDNKGKILFHSKLPHLKDSDYSMWRNISYSLKGKYGARSTRQDKEDPSTSVLHVTHPLYKGNKLIGTLTLAKPVERLSIYLDQARAKVLHKTIFTLLAILLLGYLLMKRIVDPIEKLTGYVNLVQQNKTEELPKLPQGELLTLGRTIADMRQALNGKDYIESYIEGMTHELKSPIAAIQGASELLEVNGQDNQKLLKNIKKESQRLEEMVEQLLILSRLENTAANDNFTRIDLCELLREIHKDFKERHTNRDINLDLPGEAFCQGDRNLLCTAIHNLINNALEFSTNDTQISISLTQNNEQTIMTVTDMGSGIPDYALEKVFDKFYSLPRPESGRKSSGLGLSITKEIALLHNGTITLKNNQIGASATLQLNNSTAMVK